jgi:hypothetical protein
VEAVVMVSEKALDDYEVAARARVDRLRDEVDRLAEELSAARAALSHVEITRATLTAVATSQATTTAIAGPGRESASVTASLDRSQRVPVWHAGLSAQSLPDYYRPLFAQLAESPDPVRCGQLAASLGLDPAPRKIEGVRSKLKRLVERGWAVESAPGLFAARA